MLDFLFQQVICCMLTRLSFSMLELLWIFSIILTFSPTFATQSPIQGDKCNHTLYDLSFDNFAWTHITC